jgi:quinol monooxygenase YgiN
VFHFWERYDSNVSLGKHNTTPEMEQFMNKVSRQAHSGY